MHRVATWMACGVLAGPALAATLIPVPEGASDGGEPAAELLFVRAERLIVRPGEVLEGAQVLVHDGIIRAVGQDLEPPEGAVEIEGAVVCAGFIDPWSTLGVHAGAASDPKTTAATRTTDAVDVYSNERLRSDALRAGITAVRAQAGERAFLGGVGAVIRTAPGLPREEAVLLPDSNLAASVGISTGSQPRDVMDRVGQLDKLVAEIGAGRKYRDDWVEYEFELAEWEEEIAEQEEELEDDFKKAKKDRDKKKKDADEKGKEFKEKKYKEDKKPKAPKYDADKEVFGRVADGDLPLVVEAHRSAELRGLLALTDDYERLRLVIAGGTEVLPLADELAERRIPVIVWPAPHGQTAADEFESHDLALAGRLAEKGVTVLLGSGGRAASTRDLPLLAGLAVGHGLEPEDAFEALTTGAARALDVGDRVGSVARGLSADLLVLDGEPLASSTRVRYAIVAGRVVLSPED